MYTNILKITLYKKKSTIVLFFSNPKYTKLNNDYDF
jgi:hypothetical protein